MSNLIIAIDGYSACGKSTLAKDLSLKLGFLHLDTGAMYRAVTLFFQRNKIKLDDASSINIALNNIDIHFEIIEEINYCFLNNENVESLIRSQEVSDTVSNVAAISSVRKKMVALQRKMANSKNVILEGRDIGTVVFPNADFKFFLTANVDVRSKRRFAEMATKGILTPLEEVRKNLLKRDHIDSNRKDSPLRIASNATIIDNSYLSRKEQLELIVKIIKSKK